MTAGPWHPYFDAPLPRVLAHRGLVTADAAADGVVENSFAAVAAAHAAGAEIVESDCHLTADGVVVLFHDEDLRRVTGDPRRVDEVTARELDELMAPRGGLITLAQALEAFPDLRFNLDVKSEEVAEPAGMLVAEHAQRVLVASFSDARRRRAVAAAEGVATSRPAASAGTRTVALVLFAATLGLRPLVGRLLRDVDALQVPERQGPIRVVTRRFVAALHRHGVEVHVWTVDDPAEMTRLVALGVDGIVTDRADLALDVLRGRSDAP